MIQFNPKILNCIAIFYLIMQFVPKIYYAISKKLTEIDCKLSLLILLFKGIHFMLVKN